MTIETTHRGYTIHYAENEDVWRCWDLELDAPTLSAVRRKIDTIDRKRRAMREPLEAIYLRDNLDAPRRVGVSLIAEKPDRNRTWEPEGKAWVLNDPDQRKGREKVSITHLSPITPEAEAAIAAYVAAREVEKEAAKRAKVAYSIIPRFTHDQLSALLPKEET